MKIAFCAYEINVPPACGLDVHAVKMAHGLAKLGHDVRMLCGRVSAGADLGLPVERLRTYDLRYETRDGLRAWEPRVALARYRGVTEARMSAFIDQIRAGNFEACVYAGTEGLAWLAGLDGLVRVWYAADDSFLGPISQIRWGKGPGFVAERLRDSVVGGAYEFLLRKNCEAAWLVAERDRRWAERLMPGVRVTSIPNGVDSDYFKPTEDEMSPKRLVFWGNLAFEPNIEALEWFVPAVWSELASAEPDAEFLVLGRSPSTKLRGLLDRPRIRLLADVPDLRPHTCSAPIAVYPVRGGSGIKNKFLEGASMGRALVASPQVTRGLEVSGLNVPPWIECDGAASWVESISALWRNPEEIARLGAAARSWVREHYSWDLAAARAEKSILEVAGRR